MKLLKIRERLLHLAQPVEINGALEEAFVETAFFLSVRHCRRKERRKDKRMGEGAPPAFSYWMMFHLGLSLAKRISVARRGCTSTWTVSGRERPSSYMTHLTL